MTNKCKCDNLLENFDIIEVDDDGACVKCGRITSSIYLNQIEKCIFQTNDITKDIEYKPQMKDPYIKLVEASVLLFLAVVFSLGVLVGFLSKVLYS